MGGHIEEAKKFYEEAERELEKSKQDGGMIRIRDVSGKAWNARN